MRKFNNKKVQTEEGIFDSKGEYQRWLFLKSEQERGTITNLERQVRYTLIPKQYRTDIIHLKTKDKVVQRVAEREITYTADFVYFNTETQLIVVEDYKGYPNDRWPLKKAMMLYFHGIPVREVRKPTEAI